MKMKRIFRSLLLALLPAVVLANPGEAQLQHVDLDLHDQASLQRGARTFINYCSGCHSLSFMRYNRMARDIGLTNKQVKDNLMFNATKIGGGIHSSMTSADGKKWFGNAPPDLSVVSRSRGPDWLYSYLLGFYLDPKRPSGVNNVTFRDVAMPDVLWELQGWQRRVESDHTGNAPKLELVRAGKQTPEQFRRTVRDLVNFLEYTGEPAKLVRYRIGIWAMLFLVIFATLAWKLKKEFWRDVH